MRAGRIALVAVVGLALLAPPAAASTIVRTDPNDTRSPLDLRRLRVSHVSTAHAFRIATHGAVRDGLIDGKRGWLRIGIDPTDSGWRRSVFVYLVEGELTGVVAGPGGDFLRFVGARRLGRDRFVVRIPRAVTGDLPYRFAVWSVWDREPCAGPPCVDRIPDTGTLRHGGAGS